MFVCVCVFCVHGVCLCVFLIVYVVFVCLCLFFKCVRTRVCVSMCVLACVVYVFLFSFDWRPKDRRFLSRRLQFDVSLMSV